MTATPVYRPGPIEGVDDDVLLCMPQEGLIHAYVWWASQTTHAPAWWHVGAILPCIAHAASSRGFIISDRPPNIWGALVGPSGMGKTTCIDRAQRFYTDVLETHEGSKTVDPFVDAEGTVAGIFAALTDLYDSEANATRGILVQDEFSRLMDQREAVGEMLMKVADGRNIKRNILAAREAEKAGRGYARLKNPSVSALYATTFSNLRRVTHAHHIEGGLFSRLLWFVQPQFDASKLQLHPTLRPEERRAAVALWEEFDRWCLGKEALGEAKVVDAPAEVDDILRDSLFETLKSRVAFDDRLNPSRMRALSQAYTIAGLFALSQFRTTILSEDMDAAVNLLEASVQGLEMLNLELATSDIMVQVNRAFNVIKGFGAAGCTRSKLYPKLQVPKAVIDQVLQTLLDEGSIIEFTKKRKGPGRPAKYYRAYGPERFVGPPREDSEVAEVIELHPSNGEET